MLVILVAAFGGGLYLRLGEGPVNAPWLVDRRMEIGWLQVGMDAGFLRKTE